jgi:hypothetical protein
VRETEKLISATGDHCELTLLGWVQPTPPDLLAVGNDVAVKVGVQVGTSVVTSPAVGMEVGDGVGIAIGRVEILHSKNLSWHLGLLIDPGIGTVQIAGCRTVNGPGPSGRSG